VTGDGEGAAKKELFLFCTLTTLRTDTPSFSAEGWFAWLPLPCLRRPVPF